MLSAARFSEFEGENSLLLTLFEKKISPQEFNRSLIFDRLKFWAGS